MLTQVRSTVADTLAMENNIVDAVNPRAPERRHSFLIKPKTQQSMALEVLLSVFLVVNLTVIFATVTLHNAASFSAVKEQLAFAIAIAEILGFGVLYYVCVRSNHRVAGPLFNLERCMKNASHGQLNDRISLRETDHFQEIGTAFNTLISAYDQRLHEAQRLAREIQLGRQNEEQQGALLDQLVDQLDWFTTSEGQSTG